jgi:AcrR family transcriptional regulator
MSLVPMSVKRKRRYDASSRRDHARRKREDVLDAAERRFLDRGYPTTTVADIAHGAGVSVETIYKGFGGKAGLVRAIYERGLTGRGSVPAYQRSDEMRAQEGDPETIMRNWGLLTAEVASVVSPIRLLMRSAAESEPEMAQLLEDSDHERLERMNHHAEFLEQRGYLRDDMTTSEAADVLWICSSVELYEMLVIRRSWSLPRFAQFISGLMIAQLLPPAEGEAGRT